MSKITEQLYLGSALEASDREWLKSHHVTHILNTAEEIPNYFPNDFVYMNLYLRDDMTQSLYEVLEKTYQFIWKAIGNGGTVFVHCAAGISRSSSIVIYFLMKLKGMTYIQSYNYVKSKRSQVNPNQNFARQLVSVSPQSRKVFEPYRNISNGSCTSCEAMRYGPGATSSSFKNAPSRHMLLKKPAGYSYNSVNSLGPGHSLEGMYQGY